MFSQVYCLLVNMEEYDVEILPKHHNYVLTSKYDKCFVYKPCQRLASRWPDQNRLPVISRHPIRWAVLLASTTD